MILEVFDSAFKRIGIFNNLEFAQYTDVFCGIGSWQMQVPYTSDNIALIKNGKYVLFDKGIFGEVLRIDKKTEDRVTITLKGELICRILSFRCFLKTSLYSGQISSIVRSMITNNFITPTDAKRTISDLVLATDPKYAPIVGTANMQRTGGEISTEIANILEAYGLGFEVYPNLGIEYIDDVPSTNITSLEFRILKGSDRSIGNSEGNGEVVFAISLNNMLGTEYTKDSFDEKTTAVVAGEGEGLDRIVLEAGDLVSTGLNRKELYVDARDLQTVDSAGNTIPAQTYRDNLTARGIETLKDYISSESLSGEIDTNSSKFAYGVDYFKGDIVSALDDDLGIEIKAKITEVTISDTSSGKRVDVTFGEGKITNIALLKKRGMI